MALFLNRFAPLHRRHVLHAIPFDPAILRGAGCGMVRRASDFQEIVGDSWKRSDDIGTTAGPNRATFLKID
jgi:hypothetical protein